MLDKGLRRPRKTAPAVVLPSPTIRNGLQQAFKVSDPLVRGQVADHAGAQSGFVGIGTKALTARIWAFAPGVVWL